jgi:extracellular elastinolytic metalloproteinase
MKYSFLIVKNLLLFGILLVAGTPLFAQPPDSAPDFDIRAPRMMTLPTLGKALPTDQQQALEALQREAPGLTIRWSDLTESPSRILRHGHALTAPSNMPDTAIANAFLNRFRHLYNLTTEDIQAMRLSRDVQTKHNGLQHLIFQQQANDIDVFGGELKINIGPDGAILNVSGEPIPNVQSQVNTQAPTITEEDAAWAAANAAGVTTVADSSVTGLTYFPVAKDDVRLGWRVTVEDANSPNIYDSIIDAMNSTVLWRKNLTNYDHIPAHGAVYTSDSPIPNTPKESPIPSAVSRDDVPFNGGDFFPHDDPHYDWWNGGARTTTTSNNVDAYLDQDGDNAADTGSRPTAGGGEDFTFPIDLTLEPDDYEDAAVTNLFYWNNRLHDFFYSLGFDEASGNFQTDNLGLGGSGGDAVRAEAQDNRYPSSGDPSYCNANFSTPVDGNPPRMQMFRCDRSTPERDGDLETVVIAHEYTHGVHFRLVNTSSNQAANEGWCDYFGLSVVAEPDDPYGGAYGVGDYLFNGNGNGIRFDPYSTDASIFKLTYKDLNGAASCAVRTCVVKLCTGTTDPCTSDSDCTAPDTCDLPATSGTTICDGDNPCTGTDETCAAWPCNYHEDCQPPNTVINQGLCRTSVYRTGEIWANTLLMARFNLVGKYGFAAGHRMMNQLVIDGMKLSPSDPTLLDGRDAILQADEVNYVGANVCMIWDAFARMGMGYSAMTTGVDDINPLEGYDVPTQCSPVTQVNTDTDLGEVCVGNSASQTLSIYNTGGGDLIVTNVERSSGSGDISIGPLPEIPVFISADAHVDFTVTCSPSSNGSKTATITIETNDVNTPTTDIVYTCNGGEPAIVTTFEGEYGNVCLGAEKTRELRIQNTGACDLSVSNITSSDSEFDLAEVMSFPLVVSPGGEVTVPITFVPTGDTTNETSTISITHNGTNTASPKTVTANGTSEDAIISTFIANEGSFGEVCAGSFADLPLTIQNDGACPLAIDTVSITLGTNALAGDFVAPDGAATGTIVEPGNAVQIPVRFSPSAFDSDPPAIREATVSVASHTQFASSSLTTDVTDVDGTVPPPDINVAIANSGDFGKVCKGDHADLDLTLFNQGKCNLTISSIDLLPDAGSFELPADLTFPLVLSADAEFTVPVRFAPDVCFDTPENRTVQITSDDPDEPTVDVDVTGVAPCPNLVIDPPDLTGLFAFPATVVDADGTLGCFSERTVNLRNNGECPLTIDDISALGIADAADFAVTEPSEFPIILPTGEETLAVTVRFTPQEDLFPLEPTELIGELTVVSDDPDGDAMADLCGEGVTQSGIRILVTDISTGEPVPVDEVDVIDIQAKGKDRPAPINLSFPDQPLSSSTICGVEILYHVDQETLPETDTTGSNPKSSYATKAREGNLQAADQFPLGQCEFRDFQLQLQSSVAEDCLLAPKGDPCTTDGECCSGKCRGSAGNKTCK